MTGSIDDVFPNDQIDYRTLAVIECVECGATGRMYSTGEPRHWQWWDCEECGTDDAKHRVIMSTQDGAEVER